MKMSEDVVYSLKWKNFTSNISYRLSNVFEENCFTDVTLVSDDQKQFQAHRYVLSNFSPVLENILLSNPHSHPLIYLGGGPTGRPLDIGAVGSMPNGPVG